MKYDKRVIKPIQGGRLIALNAIDGCCVTMTTAHHYGGNIVAPRQGFREMGVLVISER